ncbi:MULTISPECIES: hypothetical protein [Mycobacterium]|uniref:Uncharacterized protein n=1 Tax=Mycobacterium kiyosense TaxID=2871094 RepID=A0A9P3Q4T6_9MYCO|nr:MULTISPECIES: hypothetical protein [Mycobacterium]BDB41551.1 hypothetical protein IWGMT90018_19970 [Mycobacterium kiyosense]BDE15149.1 hypothetical protein MKCMC460_40090 [Mycobacterium sp. 20KCMC460]GLB81632.1 hypothetical protein SRL2020028_08880 [Mycobacterium kiyosense]GLB87589.1 hypothetical protein SRL2020130_04060 [Mycobacterium kiyosense]GLB94212.1 hypothetical protein SRL2020226_09880 [Mycobacterium kiyosense]
MSYTEIPTALLVEAGNLLPHMGYLFEQAEFGDIELTVDQDQMVRLLPLIRWLEYIEAKWSAEEILDEERQKLPPLARR